MIQKIKNTIKVNEEALKYTKDEYAKGILTGEHDILISLLDMLQCQHSFQYIEKQESAPPA